ncbi:MAG: dihydrolipoyl dehydrogenase [Comamonas sp. SCN 67-35]|uniref:dihydrolipoyl dehydrogenase n=1 Tax=unclassified Comamonas TaxID=2638500 RepID=UPI00086AF2EE|nr:MULTISPECIES: dihydrolipoyl dehydrogenase [unclassified Comamonas]MBN9329034.1 dihydrolipoyl dehydrogenase [Comamonas sp.]ODU38722.1 MAG: dihydrolipoyl dehydrogenase [Comamonas sp. SCN 67-35]OJX01855.1 MAG: dihydrolipoyl dehydrogenase [Burkholderiales bacterium 66-26]
MPADLADRSFDLAVIGGGPGGYTAAIRASQLGMRTVLVEREHLGGVCLNWGCIPTKALLRSAQLFRDMQDVAAHGFDLAGPVSVDMARLVGRSRAIAGQLSAGVRYLMKKNRITVIEGTARLGGALGDGRHEVHVQRAAGPMTLVAKRVILATGARARTLPGLAASPARLWTYKEAITPEALPRSLLVIGSGAIGIELGCFYRALGAEVTVVEMMERILPAEDDEISAVAQAAFERQGLRFFVGTRVEAVEDAGSGVKATLRTASGERLQVSAERVIQAIGIRGNVENLGLERTKVRVEGTHVLTGSFNETDEPGIHAIGDLAGAPWLAHKASHEAVACVEHIAGVPGVAPLEPGRVPGCTYSSPQVASVGLTEAQAKAQGRAVKVGRHRFAANGKALALGEPEGLVKMVFDAQSGELLGAHMVGAEVTELIHSIAMARTMEATEAELMHTVFPHPTLSEAILESTLDAWERAIHH